jgi:toxin FitB
VIVLHTNVLSEPLKPKPDAAVMKWLSAQCEETLDITTISIAEMPTGIEKVPKGRKRDSLQNAINGHVLPFFRDVC